MAAIRKGTLDMKITPVFCGSAFKDKGVQNVLDGVVDFLPCPIDLPPIEGTTPRGEEVARPLLPDRAVRRLAFKTISDPNGDLTFIRVYTGVLKQGERYYNGRTAARTSASAAWCACTRPARADRRESPRR
jgi:elongation factor G